MNKMNWLDKYQTGKKVPPKPWQTASAVSESTTPTLNNVRLSDDQIRKNVVKTAAKEKAIKQYAQANGLPLEVAKKAVEYSETADAAHQDQLYATPEKSTFDAIQYGLAHPGQAFSGKENVFDYVLGAPGYILGTAIPNVLDAAAHPLRTGEDALRAVDFVMGNNGRFVSDRSRQGAANTFGLLMDASSVLPMGSEIASTIRNSPYRFIPTGEEAARLTKTALLDNYKKRKGIDYSPITEFAIDNSVAQPNHLRQLSALERESIDSANKLGQNMSELSHHVKGRDVLSGTDLKEIDLYKKNYIKIAEQALKAGENFTNDEFRTVAHGAERDVLFHKVNSFRKSLGMDPLKMDDFIKKPFSENLYPFGKDTYDIFSKATPDMVEKFKNNPDILEAYNKWKSIQQSPKQEFTGLYNKKVYQPPVQNGKPFIFNDYMNNVEKAHFDNIQNAIEQSYANKAKAIQNFRKNYYLPELNNNDVYKADELLHILTARETSNPGAAVLKAYRQFQALPPGVEAIPAHSLSSNSKPLSLGVAKLAQRQGTLGDVRYYGLNELNTMGFPTKAGIPAEVVSTDINNLIHELNANLPVGKKIPYSNTGIDWTGSSTAVNYPKITYVRKKNGGWINKYK